MPASDTKKSSFCFDCNDIPLPVIIHHPQDGTIVKFNQAARKLFGPSIDKGKKRKLKNIRPGASSVKPVSRDGFIDLGNATHLTQKGKEVSLNVLRKTVQLDGKDYYADFLEQPVDNTFKTNILNGSLDAIMSTDRKGIIVEWNPAAEKIIGWKRKETIGKEFGALIIPERFKKHYQQKLKLIQKPGNEKISQWMELNIIHKSGQEFSADLSITSIMEEGQEAFYLRIRDISERKKTEQDLHQSELYLKRAQAVATIGSWEMSGRFQDTYWSDEFYRIHGLEPQSVKPSTRLRLAMVLPKDRIKMEEAIEAAFRDSKPYSIEKRIVLPNKEIRWVLSQGEVSIDSISGKKKVFGTLLDITDRKRAEEEQLESKKRLQQTLHFSRMGTAELVLATGMITVDEELFTLLEEKNSTPRSMPFHLFLKTYVLKEDIDFILGIVKEGTEASLLSEKDILLEFRVRTAKGNILHIDAQGTFRSDGTALGILRDVSRRRKAEAESNKKTALIETMLNGITDGFFAMDRDLNFTMVNPVFAVLAHKKPEEIVGRNLIELFPFMEENKLTVSYREALRSEKSITTETRNPANPKQVFQITIYPNAEGLFVYYKDISDAKRFEEEIIISRNTLANLVENLPGYVYRITNDQSQAPLFISSQFEELTGYEIDEYLKNHKLTSRKEVHPQDETRLKECVELALKTKESYSCEYRIITKQGEEKWVLEKGKGIFNGDGELNYLEGFITDVTDRKKAEQLAVQLKENDERLLHIIKNIPRGVVYQYTVNSKGKIESFPFVSEGALELFDLTPEYISANPSCLYDLVHPDDLGPMKEKNDLSREQLTLFEFEYRITTPEGTTKWLHTRAYPKKEGSGRTLWDAITLDVTERKKMEESIRENEERFRSLVRDINIGILLQGPKAEIFLSNQAALDLLGLTADQLLGRTSYDKIWGLTQADGSDFPMDELPVPKAIRTKLPIRDVVMGINRPVLKDRIWLSVDAIPRFDQDGNIINVIATFTDITARKLQEEELFQSKKYFESLVNSQSSYLIRTDMAGDYTFVNDKFREVFQPDNEELIGMNSMDTIMPVDHEACRQAVIECFTYPDKVVPVRLRKPKKNKDGYYWTEWEFVALQNENGQLIGIQSVGLDSTDRILNQLELQKTTSRFSMAKQAGQLGIWEWNLSTDELIWEDIVYEMLGFDKSKRITTEMVNHALHPDDLKIINKLVSELTPSNNSMNTVYRIVRPSDKQMRYIRVSSIAEFDSQDKIIKLTGINYDTTEQEIAIQAIRESEKRFRSLADSAPVFIWMTGTDKLCNYVNKGWLDFTGRTLEQEIGKEWTESIHPDDFDQCVQLFDAHFNQRKPFSMEYRLRRKDGQYRWILDTGNPRLLENGEFIGYIGTCFEIHERKIAENLIRESEQRFKLATAAANLGIYEWNLETNEVYFDPIAYQIFKMDETASDQLLDKWSNRIHPEDRADTDRILKKAIQNSAPHQMTYRWLTPESEELIIQVNAIVKKDASGKSSMIMGVASDITNRQKAEERLRESELRFRTMADSAPVFIWMADEDRRHSYFNKVYLDFTGRTIYEESGSGWSEQVHPQDIVRYQEVMDVAFDNRSSFTIEYRLRKETGVYRWILGKATPRYLPNGTFIGLIGSGIDITERKEAEEKLIKSEKRFNTFMKNTPVLNSIMDTKGKVHYVNESYYSLLGKKSEEVLGKSIYELVPEEIAQQFMDNITSVAKTGEVLQTIMTFPLPDNANGEYLVYKFPMGDNQVGGVAADITKQRQAERELVKSLAEKDLLIKEIHHRVKNNLQLISSILYIKMSGMQQSEIKSFLEDTRQKIRAIALIHERLLQTGSVNEVEISDYLGKLIGDLQMSNKRQDIVIKFEYKIESEKMTLDTAIYCGLIINELITNAMKHAFTGREKGTIRVFLHKAGNKHQLIIGDDGSSLPEKIVPGQSGSFGMQMLDIFVKQLNGKMEIKRGEGTTFDIVFGPN